MYRIAILCLILPSLFGQTAAAEEVVKPLDLEELFPDQKVKAHTTEAERLVRAFRPDKNLQQLLEDYFFRVEAETYVLAEKTLAKLRTRIVAYSDLRFYFDQPETRKHHDLLAQHAVIIKSQSAMTLLLAIGPETIELKDTCVIKGIISRLQEPGKQKHAYQLVKFLRHKVAHLMLIKRLNQLTDSRIQEMVYSEIAKSDSPEVLSAMRDAEKDSKLKTNWIRHKRTINKIKFRIELARLRAFKEGKDVNWPQLRQAIEEGHTNLKNELNATNVLVAIYDMPSDWSRQILKDHIDLAINTIIGYLMHYDLDPCIERSIFYLGEPAMFKLAQHFKRFKPGMQKSLLKRVLILSQDVKVLDILHELAKDPALSELKFTIEDVISEID